MILYNVTVAIDPSVHDEWLQWMKEVHIPEVLETGLFVENKMMRLLDPDETEGHTYAIQYLCRNMEDYQTYQQAYAPALQQKHTEKYKDRFHAFRTLLEVIS